MVKSAIFVVNTSTTGIVTLIGSRPLPTSSLCLCQALYKVQSIAGTTLLNIDNDSEAISESQTLVASLGGSSAGMKFLCKDAGSLESGS